MFNENWWINKNNSKELAIGWLYNNQIGNDFAKGYTKNLLDYWSVEMSTYGMWNQFAANNENEIIKKAHEEGYSKLLVIKQGNTFDANFFINFSNFYDNNSDAKFVGHILDRGSKYYRIHPQFFLIDIKWWASVGCPNWGDYTSNKFTTIKPERSEENHHDQYTPIWVKGPDNEELCEYEGTEGGWEMVQALIKDKQTILSWPEEIRNEKVYGYPEVDVDGPRHLNDVLSTCTQEDSFFIANTEYFRNLDYMIKIKKERYPNWNGKFDHVMCPAAGLTPLIYGFKFGLNKGDKITIFDVSKFAINCTKHIIKRFDGKDYKKLAYELMAEMTPSLISKDDPDREREYADKFKGINKLKYSQELVDDLNKEGFSTWIQEVLPTIKIKTEHINLFDVHSYDDFAEDANDGKTNFVHISNIFHYLPTSFFYSAKQRWNLHNELVSKLKKYSDKKENSMLLSSQRGTMISKDKTNNMFRKYAATRWIEDYPTTSWSSLEENKLTRIFKWNQ